MVERWCLVFWLVSTWIVRGVRILTSGMGVSVAVEILILECFLGFEMGENSGVDVIVVDGFDE